MALFLGLLALNLAANLPDYRSMGVPEAELMTTAPPLPVRRRSGLDIIGSPMIRRFSFQSLAARFRITFMDGRALLALFACAGPG